jgi:hypothetical protein
MIGFPIPRTIVNVWAFLGLIGYYKNYIRGYARIRLIKWDNVFQWPLKCQKTFDQLKEALVSIVILVRLDFCKMFVLDVNLLVKGVGAIYPQKNRRWEYVVAYANKGLYFV